MLESMTMSEKPADAPERILLEDHHQLYSRALTRLGHMNIYTYSEFQKKMIEFAREKEISQPLMVLDVRFDNIQAMMFGKKEFVHHVHESEWDVIKGWAIGGLDYLPSVYVVDGSRYKAERVPAIFKEE